jgi:probable HAF family extracellular repeat protein
MIPQTALIHAKAGLLMKRFSRTHRYQLESLETRRLLTTYTVDLGELPGRAFSEASDINASGHVVGTASTQFGESRAFIWRNGVMTDLGTLEGDSKAYGINDAGQVVGEFSAQTSATTYAWRAFLVTPEDTDGNGAPDRWFRDSNADGKNDLMRNLGTTGGNTSHSVASDVNNLGQVVGSVWTSSTSRAFRWQNGVMTDMGTFGGQRSSASAINDAGQIVGWFSSAGQSRAFIWKAGVVTDLGVSGGAADINASGQVVDMLDPIARVWTPTVPNGTSGTFAVLGQRPPFYSDATVKDVPAGINAAGQIVGNQWETYSSEISNGIGSFGVRWVNGAPEQLPLEFATAINDAGQIVGAREGRATLLADENFAVPLITISNATVAEGNSGTTNAVVTVSLSKAGNQPITVHYATADGTAYAGGDYLAASGTLTFAPGQTTGTITVPVFGDRAGEGGEYFAVVLSSPTNSIIVVNGATVTILDDEPAILANRQTIVEGNTGSVTALVTVSLSNAYDQTVVVAYATRDGTATAGSDYVATSGTLTFAPGQTVKQVPVTILGDHVVDRDVNGDLAPEDLFLGFSSPSGNAYYPVEGTITIQDDEPYLYVSWGESVSEGNAGTTDLVFTVRLSAPYDQEVTVDYKAPVNVVLEGYEDAWAVAGSDYVNTAGTVRFAPGQTSRTVHVPVIGDTVVETNEYLFLAVSNPSSNAWISNDYGLGEIRNDDGPAKTWVGPASGGNWSTATNWSPSGVPGASDQVTLSAKAVNLSANATFATLTLTGGASLTVAPNGSRVLRTSNLWIDGNSKLNLNDNQLILDYGAVSPIGSWNGSAYTGVTGMIQSGAITSAGNGKLTTLGVGHAGGDVLVKYTYAGDANLDGVLNIDDYTRIDSSIGLGRKGWSNGDFNYDGKINVDDYIIIDANIDNQGPPFTNSSSLEPPATTPALAGYSMLHWRDDERRDRQIDLLGTADGAVLQGTL